MSRAAYTETICSIAADGTMKAAGNVQVTVRKLSDNSIATVWKDRTSSSPANKIDAPFSTPSTGLIQIYADPDIYKLEFHDLNLPVRMSDYSVIWDAVPGDINPVDLGFQVGDLKLSSIATDHGRWLRLDGREMNQALVEGALSLPAGEGAAIMAYLGTGPTSKYGAATPGYASLPDARRKSLMGAGASGDTTPAPMANTTARPLGNTGGVETVTLTSAQSGLRGHGHTVTDPGHPHGVTDPGHGHPGSTSDSQQPAVYIGNAGNHEHAMGNTNAFNTALGASGDSSKERVVRLNDWGGGDFYRWTATSGDHSHYANQDWHSHNLSIAGAYTGITINGNTTGVAVNNVTAADATSSHSNMSPFISIGYVFIRV